MATRNSKTVKARIGEYHIDGFTIDETGNVKALDIIADTRIVSVSGAQAWLKSHGYNGVYVKDVFTVWVYYELDKDIFMKYAKPLTIPVKEQDE